MTQVFIFGASTAYGAGGAQGGWADMLKRDVHNEMFGKHGIGEKHEVFNFAKSGAPAEFVQETFPDQLKHYSKPGRKIAIISVGMNNARADHTPENFVSSINDYIVLMTGLLKDLQLRFDQLLVVGYHVPDETKTVPFINIKSGHHAYFWAERNKQFNAALKQICAENEIIFIDPIALQDKWAPDYLYDDGLHPNDAGYRLIYDALKPNIIL